MDENFYIEDIFCNFYRQSIRNNINLGSDQEAAANFYHLLVNDNLLTRNQGIYLLKILKKNQSTIDFSFDDVKWRNQFRTIDNSRRISVEEENDEIFYHFQFPYIFKETFDKEFITKNNILSIWDNDKKVRKMRLYDHNVLKVFEFCKEHNFSMDRSFLEVYSDVEEFYNQENNIVPICYIEENTVFLKNAKESAIDHWNKHKRNILKQDLLLAKSMGYILDNYQDTGLIEKICSSKKNNFWLDEISKFFMIYKEIDTKVCVVLDRNSDVKEWIENFVSESEKHSIPRNHIKVCFREKNDEKENINTWIHHQGLGGKIDEGKIFFFLHSPAKWFYKDLDSFKIILFNNIIPSTNNSVKVLAETHPLVLHIDSIKPTKMREIEIETL
jgi:hypothetical protein